MVITENRNAGIRVKVLVRVEVVAVVVMGVTTVIGGHGRDTSDLGPVRATDHHLVHLREKVAATELGKDHHHQNVTNEDDETFKIKKL